ncbi:MAG: tetratricopeptide repeat protein [Alphaproteobacteria bacterium]|nr:MAG: tetratricopeptide repeat protein [Alphaproteobacteria bacterium]
MNRRERRAAAKQGRGAAPPSSSANLGPCAALAEAARHHQAGRLRQAERVYRRVLAGDPNQADCLHLLGLVLHQTGRSAEALQLIERAIALNGADPDLHNDIAGIYQSLGRFDEAVTHCRSALALSPSSGPVRLNLARALYAQGDLTGSVSQYRELLRSSPDSADCHFSLGLVLCEQGDVASAITHYRRVLALRPEHTDAHAALGNALAAQGQWNAAIGHYRASLAVRPECPKTLNALGDALAMTGALTQAIEVVQRAATLRSDLAGVHANLAYFKRQACDWTDFDRDAARVLALLRQGARDVPPFVTLMLPAEPADRLLAARRWSEGIARGVSRLSHKRPAAERRIRLGYLSHDFRGDVVGRLLPELIERHDRSRFRVSGYCYGPDDGSDVRHRLVAAFDSFVDLTAIDDATAAERIHADGIDILVDLTGYTSENPRTRILAFRPAPIQVNFLGFPGTMGAEFIDYIIVDDFLAPEDHQPGYSETLIQSPHCYQPSDTARPTGSPALPRAACGLPADGFVFCCFNHSYKLTPTVFDIWMRLLNAVPGSVLWLLEANTDVPGNLRREAAARGIAAERLVFAGRAPVPEYMARLAAADLFLDTLPYNAGATANDALWAGLPVLTCAGDTYVGRMAGSMLHAIGLSYLVTSSLAEYEVQALQLAKQPARLAELRRRLSENRARMPLFDMARYTRDIEAAYARMWDRWITGQSTAR